MAFRSGGVEDHEVGVALARDACLDAHADPHRLGREALDAAFEIDTTDDRLFVLTRWDLGTDPLDVLDALTAAGYAN